MVSPGEKQIMCMICSRIADINRGRNDNFVCELETGYLVLGDHQYFKGYCVFLAKQCVPELFLLEKTYRTLFLEEMNMVAQAVFETFPCEKINYELLGNGDSHVHWHIFPRRNNDIGKKGPVWWLDPNEMWNDKYILTDSERCEMISKLQTKINELISFGHYE
jgi:diadenosine tetraphosphate (Ap4A) HIT family hydrolase